MPIASTAKGGSYHVVSRTYKDKETQFQHAIRTRSKWVPSKLRKAKNKSHRNKVIDAIRNGKEPPLRKGIERFFW